MFGEDEEDELQAALEEAFPQDEWTPERVEAFRRVQEICSGGYHDEEDEESGGNDDALLIFGKPKKSK